MPNDHWPTETDVSIFSVIFIIALKPQCITKCIIDELCLVKSRPDVRRFRILRSDRPQTQADGNFDAELLIGVRNTFHSPICEF